ncbi:MAG: hypothetical protein ABIS47_10045 [Acidimicrobiales bacterium]
MAIIVSVFVVALVMAVAAGAIGREARRLDALPPRAVFDLEEAVVWVADHLPDDVTAQLSYAEVRQILDLSLDHLRSLGLAGSTTGERVEGEVVVDEAAAVAAVLDQAGRAGMDVSPHQVQAVLAAQLAYLQAISAVGPPVEE